MDTDIEITEIFNSYLSQHKSVDIAERAFKQDLAEDSALRQAYGQWCHDVGSTEKNGFYDYSEEYLEQQNEVWDALNDYDNEE